MGISKNASLQQGAASRQALIILDLDETLIHATEARLERAEDFRVGPYYVYNRPHVTEFLEFCAQNFAVAVWTTSSSDFATSVVEALFSSRVTLQFVWSRSKCTPRYDSERQEWYWVKDLKKIRKLGYSLERVIVVDDTPQKHERNYGNLVQVRPFEGRPDDELLHLTTYLRELATVENVRMVEKRGWRGTTATNESE